MTNVSHPKGKCQGCGGDHPVTDCPRELRERIEVLEVKVNGLLRLLDEQAARYPG